jgi:four helix bundle protein
MAKTVEELPLFQRAIEFCAAVNAILERPAFGRNGKLRNQIAEANESITANMREGFEQPSDDAFANYVYIAKSSLGEVLARLASARSKRWITDEDFAAPAAMGNDLGKMMGGFIKYLARSGFKDRGRFKSRSMRQRKG